jgi:hypothetical protein
MTQVREWREMAPEDKASLFCLTVERVRLLSAAAPPPSLPRRAWKPASKPLTVPTLLMQANRSAGRDRVHTFTKRENRPVKLETPADCRECGVILEDRSRQYCQICIPIFRNEQAASFTGAGRVEMQELRTSGIDPSQTGEAAEKRRSVVKHRRHEELKWDAAHPDVQVDEAAFAREILPRLRDLSLSQLSAEMACHINSAP